MKLAALYSRARKAFLDSIEAQQRATKRSMEKAMAGASAKQRAEILQLLMAEFKIPDLIPLIQPIEQAIAEDHTKLLVDGLKKIVKGAK